MLLPWIDPKIRSGAALGAILLAVTSLVLADPGARGVGMGRISGPLVQTDPVAYAEPPPLSSRESFADFRGRGIHGHWALSHGRVLANGTRRVFAELRISAETMERVEAPPVALALVIDTSGSMGGSKIEDAKRSALAMLRQMRPQDRIAIINFSEDAHVVVPLSTVGSATHEAELRIAELRPGGSTNIAKAIAVAASQLDGLSRGGARRVVLVTDGRDTSGAPRRQAEDTALARGWMTVSALGIGTDYDDSYLAGLARVGRGNYGYLEDTQALNRFLSAELSETSRTTVTAATASLSLPAGASISDVWGATWSGTSLQVGSLFAGDERRVIVALNVPAGAPGNQIPIQSHLNWSLVDGSRESMALPQLRMESVLRPDQVDDARDFSVIASATSLSASRDQLAATQAYERGDYEKARRLNEAGMGSLAGIIAQAPAPVASALRAQQRAYEQNGQVYAAPAKSPQAAAHAARSIGARELRNEARDVGY